MAAELKEEIHNTTEDTLFNERYAFLKAKDIDPDINLHLQKFEPEERKNFISCLDRLQRAKLLTPENYALLKNCKIPAYEAVSHCLTLLQPAGALTQESYTLLLTKIKTLPTLERIFMALAEANYLRPGITHFLFHSSDETILLLGNPSYLQSGLLTQAHFELLRPFLEEINKKYQNQSGENDEKNEENEDLYNTSREVLKYLFHLTSAGLNSPENCQLLLNNRADGCRTALEIMQAHALKQGIIYHYDAEYTREEDEVFEELSMLIQLKAAKLYTEDNIGLLTSHFCHRQRSQFFSEDLEGSSIALAFSYLRTIGLGTQEKFQVLLKCRDTKELKQFTRGFNYLRENEALTKETATLLLSHSKHAYWIAVDIVNQKNVCPHNPHQDFFSASESKWENTLTDRAKMLSDCLDLYASGSFLGMEEERHRQLVAYGASQSGECYNRMRAILLMLPPVDSDDQMAHLLHHCNTPAHLEHIQTRLLNYCRVEMRNVFEEAVKNIHLHSTNAEQYKQCVQENSIPEINLEFERAIKEISARAHHAAEKKCVEERIMPLLHGSIPRLQTPNGAAFSFFNHPLFDKQLLGLISDFVQPKPTP